MPDSPDTIPIDDRAWPRSSVPISVVMVLAAVGTCTGLTVSAVGRGPGAVLAIVIGFVSAFGFEFAVLGAAFRCRFAGRTIPGRFRLMILVPVLIAFVIIPTASAAVGTAVLAGAIGGLMATNLWAKRAARAYRDIVAAAEAALAHDREETQAARPAYGAATTPSASVGQLLHEAVANDRRRWLAWLVAGGAVTAAGLILGAPASFTYTGAILGALAVAWVTRRLWGVWLARRDFERAATLPRRAFMVLLAPSPGSVRPRLGTWSTPPVVRDGRMPAPEQVYLCCDQRDALECKQGSTVLHEAWLGTGPRSTSKPRWVAADAGIAVPHRRAIFGRWLLSNVMRGERPGRPVSLTRRPPQPDIEPTIDPNIHPGSTIAALAWRLAALTAAGLLAVWLP